MNSSSSELGRKLNKTGQSRRIWTAKEEEVLLVAVKELIANNWKSDNGFRAGYLVKLEEAMRVQFKHTDLKGSPHIASKLTSWKKNYSSLTSILAKSGMGGLTGNYMIDCDNDDQWDEIIKLDNNARGMRYKSWPFYNDWKEIFGKDRATGENAECVRDAYNEFLQEESQPSKGYDGDYHVNMEEIYENEGHDENFSQSRKTQPTSSQIKKKLKVNSDLEKVCEVLAQMGHDANERLERLVNRIGVEFDVRKAKQEAFDKLGSIPRLSMDEKFDVCVIMAGKVELLEIFTGLPEEARPLFVAYLLKNKEN